jgi:hypothetical protein
VFPVVLQVVFRDPVRYKLQKVLTVAAEGTYSGQVCWCIRAPQCAWCWQLKQRMGSSFGSSSIAAMQLQQQHRSNTAAAAL